MGIFGDKEKEKSDNGDSGNTPGVISLSEKPENGKRGRGRPPGSGSKSGSAALSNGQDGADKKLLDEIYQPKMWGEVGALPFQIRKVITGSDVFNLTSNQKDIIGVSLATTLKQFGIVDPKYAALTVLLVNFSTIMLEMEVRYRAGLPPKEDKRKAEIKKDELKTESLGIVGGGFNVG